MAKSTSITKLNQKPDSILGIVGTSLGLLSVLLFLAAVIYLAVNRDVGVQQPIAGITEWIAIMMNLAGSVFSFYGLKDYESEPRFPRLGLYINGFILFFHGVVLYQGYMA